MRSPLLALALGLLSLPASAQLFNPGNAPVFKEEELDKRFSKSKVHQVLLKGTNDPNCVQVVGGLLTPKSSEVGWRVVFIAGLLLGAFGYMLATGGALPVRMQASLPVLVVAGLLVGFGTRFGSGCTSGHGLCGIGRLSKRSIVASVVFFGVAMVTVFLTRHVI